ncbi:MAG: phosphohistidine phosphatase SixA [Acidimicrobiales bacterium]
MSFSMDAFLIRHAQAGHRNGDSHDLYRPLTDDGHARAAELADLLASPAIGRVLSSPATRCAQTVAPLATACRLEVEEHPDLFEGSRVDHVLALLESFIDESLVVCSHGDVIPDVVDALAKAGVEITGRGCEKGSVWKLTHDGTRWTSASRYPAT